MASHSSNFCSEFIQHSIDKHDGRVSRARPLPPFGRELTSAAG
ncbi:hypothetical protein HMPREF0072_0615 [Anaerococcus lactolyticus ATCC 51172]|uniref:Uncharacterized protein n=1 Tax=Anaerococcus lactolyticus ATCC 51172 TaxID=525254 RepID=C2BE45_9FIRM|nr:hypothetical protein HMPREF0072_0615 [Anaerococcus lactolyticus ATCC 51172]